MYKETDSLSSDQIREKLDGGFAVYSGLFIGLINRRRTLFWISQLSSVKYLDLYFFGQSKMTHGTEAEMIPEVSAAASFVCRLLRSRGHLSDVQLQVFRDGLAQALSGNKLVD